MMENNGNLPSIRKHDFSIDLIKAVAVFIIINSHADVCYAKFSSLATGGAIGDGLFLFCSGFTLFLGRTQTFANYYKRRIQRIYPSVFASLIVMICLGSLTLENFSVKKFFGGEFVIAIMTYYVILFFIRKFMVKKMKVCFLFVIMATLLAYYFFPYKYETGIKGLYGISTLFRWVPYFGLMLLGAYVGLNKNRMSFNLSKDALKCILSLCGFYVFLFVAQKHKTFAPMQIFTLPILACIVFYFYKVCNSSILQRVMSSRLLSCFVLAVGGLCLESYLIQNSLMTDRLNSIFPFNIPLIF